VAIGDPVRTFFETSWVRDTWSPNLGQASSTGGFFSDLTKTAQTAIQSIAEVEKAEEERKLREAQMQAAIEQAKITAARPAPPSKILGMSPTTAAIVGVATLAAIIGGVALLGKKK
jgi:hypothetical protein